MQAQEFPELHPKIVLGIAAHPDDLDFGAAGTMARFAAEGADVHYLILTDGSKGSSDPNITSEQLVKLREAEQRAAVEAVGGKSVQFLGHPDGGLEVSLDLKKELVKVIRTIKPDVVVTMDPTLVYSASRGMINHPDHRAAGQATLDAVFPLARDHLSFPELYEAGYQPHITPTVLLINFDNANTWFDITDTFSKKVASLAAHESQIEDVTAIADFMRGYAAEAGKAHGMDLAEGFVRIDIR